MFGHRCRYDNDDDGGIFERKWILSVLLYGIIFVQYLLVVALQNLKTTAGDELAYKWASRWVLSNFIGYKQTQYMFEKVRCDGLCTAESMVFV